MATFIEIWFIDCIESIFICWIIENPKWKQFRSSVLDLIATGGNSIRNVARILNWNLGRFLIYNKSKTFRYFVGCIDTMDKNYPLPLICLFTLSFWLKCGEKITKLVMPTKTDCICLPFAVGIHFCGFQYSAKNHISISIVLKSIFPNNIRAQQLQAIAVACHLQKQWW